MIGQRGKGDAASTTDDSVGNGGKSVIRGLNSTLFKLQNSPPLT
jgi:hypothetical protein